MYASWIAARWRVPKLTCFLNDHRQPGVASGLVAALQTNKSATYAVIICLSLCICIVYIVYNVQYSSRGCACATVHVMYVSNGSLLQTEFQEKYSFIMKHCCSIITNKGVSSLQKFWGLRSGEASEEDSMQRTIDLSTIRILNATGFSSELIHILAKVRGSSGLKLECTTHQMNMKLYPWSKITVFILSYLPFGLLMSKFSPHHTRSIQVVRSHRHAHSRQVSAVGFAETRINDVCSWPRYLQDQRTEQECSFKLAYFSKFAMNTSLQCLVPYRSGCFTFPWCHTTNIVSMGKKIVAQDHMFSTKIMHED